jgi:hypothetical protein
MNNNINKDRKLLAFILANDVVNGTLIFDSYDKKENNNFLSIYNFIYLLINESDLLELNTIRTLRSDKTYTTIENLIKTAKLLNI